METDSYYITMQLKMLVNQTQLPPNEPNTTSNCISIEKDASWVCWSSCFNLFWNCIQNIKHKSLKHWTQSVKTTVKTDWFLLSEHRYNLTGFNRTMALFPAMNLIGLLITSSHSQIVLVIYDSKGITHCHHILVY